MKTRSEILGILKGHIARETGLPLAEISDDATFYSLGLDSISSVFILDRLEKQLKIEMNPVFFWDFPTVGLLADHITTLGAHE
jgi:acyl carrier protein